MPNAKEISLENKPINVFFFGAPKTGKTSMVKTFPGLAYVFDFDDGIWPLMGHDVEYDTYVDTDPRRPEAFIKAKKRLEEIKRSAKDTGVVEIDGRKVDLVVLDGSTALLASIMGYVLMTQGRPGGVPQQNDYGPQMTEYTNFINGIKSLPCNVLIIAHEKVVEDQTTGAVRMLPDLTGKLSGRVSGMFDIVFRSEIRKVGSNLEHRLLTRHQGLVEAGHRFVDAFDVYEPMDFGVILKKIAAYSSAHKPTNGGK